MQNQRQRIAIIGAGVSGLSTAITLFDAGHSVSVFASRFHPNITSSMAAAFWYPFWTGAVPDHSWYRKQWAADTLRILLNHAQETADSGISAAPLVEYFPDNLSEKDLDSIISGMWWRHLASLSFKPLSTASVSHVGFSSWPLMKFRHGITFNTLVVNMNDYLPYLMEILHGQCLIRKETIGEGTSLRDLLGEFDYVVNCGGLEAARLVDDPERMTPVEGVVVRMPHSKEVNKISLIHTGYPFDGQPIYIVPRHGVEPDIILGGTLGQDVEGIPRTLAWDQVGTDDRLVDEADTIVRGCKELEPALRRATPLSVGVGYRPSRTAVRLEVDFSEQYGGRLIHNYGHGGGGITLSWGCALAISRWVDRLIELNASDSLITASA